MPHTILRIPIVTSITAGRGIPDEYTDWEITGFRDVRLDGPVNERDRFFAVPVQGDSLKEHHIIEGDLLICRITRDYEDGQIGIWQTPTGRTAKFGYYDMDNSVVLHNGADWRQSWDSSDVHLLGQVIKIERDAPRSFW